MVSFEQVYIHAKKIFFSKTKIPRLSPFQNQTQGFLEKRVK
jgi:hypothetical protein